jgi:hypothetical protein
MVSRNWMYFSGQEISKKNSKKVLHLFSSLDTSEGNPHNFGAEEKAKKFKKKYCIYFPVLIQAH